MRFFCPNKALLWKEWRQNRWVILIAFLLLCAAPLAQNLLYWYIYHNDPYFNGTRIWMNDLAGLMFWNTNAVNGRIGFGAALIIGVLLIGQERSGTLDFLATMPVSRREIFDIKFSLGAVTLTGIMIFNLVLIVLAQQFFPTRYTLFNAINWFVQTLVVLLAIYSFSFLVAAFTGNIVAAISGSFGLIFLPSALREAVLDFLLTINSNFNLDEFRLTSLKISDALNLPSYLPSYMVQGTSQAGRYFNRRLPVMILVIVIFFLLSRYFFTKNPMEKNGRILMLGNIMSIMKVVVPLTAGFIVVAATAQTIKSILALIIVFTVTAFFVYRLLLYLQMIQSSRGEWDECKEGE